jgi:hypothetical protein
MNEHLHIVLAPLVPLPWIEAFGAATAAIAGYGIFRRAQGSIWRAGVGALLLLALADPSLIAEQREPLKDTALIVVDESASMKIGDRAQQAAQALEALQKKLADFSDLDTVTVHAKGSDETDLFRAAQDKLTAIPHERLAGTIFITDGEVHDQPDNAWPGPLHALIAGKHDEIDRRIAVTASPAYGIVGKSAEITLRIDDAPQAQSDSATVTLHRDDGETQTLTVPVGKDTKLYVPVGHAGGNLFAFSVAGLPQELTTLNNSTAVTINGIRDRLRVLLISGEPHIGGRMWRDLLKADPAVDLVHFTILRSPSKQDFTPNNELALIAFPVQELFETKLASFDLVIFDLFRQQTLIPDEYLENIAHYVEQGGALLVSNATDEGIPSLTLSPLARVLPTEPSGKLMTGSFVSDLTDAGKRHPVTDTLTAAMPRSAWGPWFRQNEARVKNADAEILLTGLQNQPLLVLDHVGKGRVAQFLSDQFWLWARNYKGGGPQADLLKRTSHWLMQEPELDENALRATAQATDNGWQLSITKRSLKTENTDVEIADPEGNLSQVTLTAGKQPGMLSAALPVSETGLYRVKETGKTADKNDKNAGNEILVLVGPSASPEFGEMIATEQKLSPTVTAGDGGIFWLADHPDGPEIKRTGTGGAQHGWNWIGLRHNDQYRVTGSKAYPLWPAWLAIAVLLGIMMMAWRREGK